MYHDLRDVMSVEKHYKFPFKLHQFQYETVLESVIKGSVLNRAPVGCGKTAMALYLGLFCSLKYAVRQILIIMPPSLIDQWDEFIQEVEGIDSVLIFRGSPAERKKMDLTKHAIVLVSNRIFVKDFKRFEEMGQKNRLFIIGDELSLKSSNQTYRCWKQLIYRKLRLNYANNQVFHNFTALNATPVSDRLQVYWWCSIFNPDAYSSLRVFKKMHVAKEDNWGKPLAYMAESYMDDRFDEMSVIPKNVRLQLPEQVYTKIPYSLIGEHKKLYDKVLNAEFEKLDPSIFGAVDAMFSLLQRLVLCPSEFGLNIPSPVIEIIDQRLDQMDEDDKVILFTRHVVVSEMLTKHYGKRAVSYFGKVSKTDKFENLKRFKNGEAEIMVANLDSLSKGQNLQVANQTIFVELPFRSDSMTQACGRTARQGQQKKTCFFYLPVAKGTIQTRICDRLLANDMDLRKFNNNKKSLEEWLKG